jgi:hypothetical protein
MECSEHQIELQPKVGKADASTLIIEVQHSLPSPDFQLKRISLLVSVRIVHATYERVPGASAKTYTIVAYTQTADTVVVSCKRPDSLTT